MSRTLWAVIAGGTVVKLVLAFVTFGTEFDIGSAAAVVNEIIDGDPFGLYADLPSSPVPRWPYPPGFFPFILISGALARLLPGGFDAWIQLAPIVADAAIAYVLARVLARRGQPPRVQLAAVSLVAAGPLFAWISGVSFQIDSVPVLPALLAVVVWDDRLPRRAIAAGLLVGVAATVKTPLGLILLALLPTARDRREAAVTAACAVGVPALSLVPFLIGSGAGALLTMLDYRGVTGQAMLGALVQPDQTVMWLTLRGIEDYASTLDPYAPLLLAAIAAGVLAVGLRHRPPALALSLVLWPAVWAFGSGFLFHYLIWGLPFLLLACRFREAAALQAMGTGALAILWTIPHDLAWVGPYRVLIYTLHLFTLVVLFRSVQQARVTSAVPA